MPTLAFKSTDDGHTSEKRSATSALETNTTSVSDHHKLNANARPLQTDATSRKHGLRIVVIRPPKTADHCALVVHANCAA